ncbi:tetratricopeptide repeat protein [Candidatus Parcubacteria bacterium]|nr:tetratricopeptide repeat protein [Candidatus Parcubacteria bacterium]
MTFDLIPQIIIIISTGIIIVILGRNIPKVKNLNEENLFLKKEDEKEKEKFFYLYSRIKKRVSKEEYRKRVDLMWVWLEKILRKTRISFLKIDNKIISLLDKLREKHVETEIDKSEKADDIDKYEDVKKGEIEENRVKEKDKLWTGIQEKKDDKFLRKETGIVKNELQKSEFSENIDSDEMAEIINKDKQKKIINNISEKEDAKGKEKEYIEMILKNPINIKAYWKLGIVYSRRKNYKDAISCFRQITKIDPTYTKAKKKITDLMERMKDKKEEKKKAKEEKKIVKEEK